ncbi:hypothetical protein AB0869_32440 [Micromonospora vinacea]|uniref:hypothetical protein n=1 Tax=Micromonospora vinacea TaxID=709878 RepID=UPI00345376B2
MPPRRRPRSWLAGRLRSAAGAVQRLAGRVEPADHLPTPSPTPVATPRRFGEPPQHWLDLVAAHAPGLLHDLDLDPSPAGNAGAGAGGPGEATGRVDADGANPGANAGSGGSGRPGSEADVGGPGASGDEGPTRSRAGLRTGRSGRPGQAGDQPDGTQIGAAGGGVPSSSSDATIPPAGSNWPDASTPPAGSTWPPDTAVSPVGRSTRGDTMALATTALTTTAVDVSGPPPADGPRQQVRSMVFRPHDAPGSRPHRAEADATRTASHPSRDARWSGGVDRGQSPGSSPAPPAADRPSGVRDGSRGDSADGQARPGSDQREHARRAAPGAARTPRVDPAAAVEVSSGRPAWPNLGGVDASWAGSTATSTGDPSTSGRGDLARVVDGGPWLTLPGEPAPPGRPAARRDAGTGAAGGQRAPSLDGPPPSAAARNVDPWPALPDDTALWSVVGAAVDTAQLTRLDREQAGD